MKREKWINVRFERRIADIIDQVCRARGEDRSSFIRWSVKNALATLNYLTHEEKKALGILEPSRERGSAENTHTLPRKEKTACMRGGRR